MRAPLLLFAVLLVADLAGCSSSLTPGSSSGPIPPPPALQHTVFSHAVNMTSGSSARETSLALSPTDPNLLFACDPSGVPAVGNGHSYFYVSHDNGTTWSDVDNEDQQVDLRKAAFEGGDCDVAVDAAGTLYTADTWLGDLSVGSSKDGGATWTVGTSLAGTAPAIDRPWLVGGPAGTVYLTYQDVQFGMPAAIWFTKSTDYGQTFMPAVPVATATQAGLYSWEGNFVVVGEQDLHLVYNRRATGVVGLPTDSPAEDVTVATSHDSGLTWTSTIVSHRLASASYLYPAIAADSAGDLHVVFSQASGGMQPTWYSRSTDAGATWSEPIPLMTNVTSGSPWIAAGKPGQAAAIFFGCDGACSGNDDLNWTLYSARIVNGTVVEAGPVTGAPLFHGKQQLGFAEFNMVRLDAWGRMRIGASVPFAKQADGSDLHWQAMYVPQLDGPAT